MTARTRIFIAFAGALLVSLLVGALAFWSASAIRTRLGHVASRTLPGLQALTELRDGQSKVMLAAYSGRSAHGVDIRLLAQGRAQLGFQQVDEAAASFEAVPRATHIEGLWSNSKQTLGEWSAAAQTAIKALQDRDQVAVRGDSEALSAAERAVSAAFAALETKFGRADGAMNDLMDVVRADAEAVRADGEQTATRATSAISAAFVLGAVVMILIALSLGQRIGRTLRALREEAEKLSEAVRAGDLAVRCDRSRVDAEFRSIVDGMNATMDAFTEPIGTTSQYLARIARGEVPAPLQAEYRGDFNGIKDSLNSCIAAVNALVEDATRLARAGAAGDLGVRAEADRHAGDFRRVIEGFNASLDAVVGPISDAAACVARIARGDVPQPITSEYAGDFIELKENLNRCIEAVKALVTDANMLSRAAVEGKLATRADASRHEGDFRKIIQGVNDTLDAVIGPLNAAARCVDDISKGKIPPEIDGRYDGDFSTIRNNLNQCIRAVNALVADAHMLATAAVEGRLTRRADPSSHQGDFRRIIDGINRALDAVVGPLTAAARHIDVVAEGRAPPAIGDAWAGDFAKLRESLNRVTEVLRMRGEDVQQLMDAALEGQLSFRADASKYVGENGRMISGFNAVLDAVLGPVQSAARCIDQISRGEIPPPIAEKWKGEFGTLRDSINRCIGAVNALVADAHLLAGAAVEGKLATRADAAKHQGDFRKIVEGVNGTLDAVIAPVNEAAQVLDKLAQRDLRARMSGSYQGDHAKIKESLNVTGDALQRALGQVAEAVEQVTSAASQIASSSQSIASGASEQASSIEETGSSLESMASSTRQNADNAQQANQLAQAARGAAAEGTAAMEQMEGAMDKIRASAEGTSQIIKDINEIAFQTNLLALNAAVEAARAGEAGRGFAVVAEEVRSLALRSKGAAMKTEELIRQSVKEAEAGAFTSKQVNDKLSEIARSIGKVTDIVAEIAAASKEQAVGIEQVDKAVAEMDKVTQRNAASSEESSSAAEELSSQAQELAAMVGSFYLGRAAKAVPAKVPKPATNAAATNGKAGRGKGTSGVPLDPRDVIPLNDGADSNEF